MVTGAPSTVHIETEGQSTRIEDLRGLPHLMVARTLNVPEEALEPEAAIEPGAARDLHGSLHRLDDGASHKGAPDQDLAGRLDADHPFGRRFVAPLRRNF